MWDERYSGDEYLFGKEPNYFVNEMHGLIPKGRVLCIAEGEGRNAVFLAEQGYQVYALDSSAVGLTKAKNLASERGVHIETICQDLREFRFEPDSWDGIVSVFCHLPPELRMKVHKGITESLKTNGVLLLVAYSKEQVHYKTGGPSDVQMLYALDDIRNDLKLLTFAEAEVVTREVVEGTAHTGLASIVQIAARKM